MKVAIFSEAFLSQTSAVETQVAILARGLKKLGHQALIVTTDTEAEDCYLEQEILFCPAKLSGGLYGQSARRSKISQLNSFLVDFDPDMIHLLTLGEIGEAGLKYALAHDLPLVTTIHNLIDVREGFEGNRLLGMVSKNYCQGVFKRAVTFSDVITSSSLKAGDELLSLGITAEILPVPLCVDNELFRRAASDEKSRAAMRTRFGLANKTGILFVGKLNSDNQVDHLLDDWAKAISPSDRLQLVIVGSGSGLQSLREKANVLNISSQVTFAGTVPHDQMNICYDVCAAFVSACDSPVMKAAPLEAIFCGLPVILHRDSASADLVTEGVNGFLYEDGEKLGKLLKMLSTLTPEKEESLKKLVSRTAASMTIEAQTKAYIETYRQTNRKHYKKAGELE